MSRTKELLYKVLDVVSGVTEIDRAIIMSRNKSSEVVDARYILIEMLHQSGIYTSKIASEIGFSVRNVQYVLSHFDERIAYNRPMRNDCERVRKLLGNI